MIWNCPLASVTTDRAFSMRAGLVASTETPGRMAPEVSRTVPAIDCAKTRDGRPRQSAAKSSVRTKADVCDVIIDAPKLVLTLASAACPAEAEGGGGRIPSRPHRKVNTRKRVRGTFARFLSDNRRTMRPPCTERALASRCAVVLLALAVASLVTLRLSAQGGGARPPDIAGEWRLDSNEDPGQPPLADYLGLALNEAGRLRADTTPESIWGTPEYQCRPHSAPHQWRGRSEERR